MRPKSMASLFILLLSGCGVTTETTIEDRTIMVVPDTVIDTVSATRVDTLLVEGQIVLKADTVVVVRYFPQEKKFWIKVKPDTIRVTYRDTTVVLKPEIIETPFLSKMGLVAIGVILAVVGATVLKFKGIF